MKSSLTPAPKTLIPETYPCLKQWKDHNGYIVLFVGPKAGIVVNEGPRRDHGLGKVSGIDLNSDRWAEDEFITFDGTVTLSNR